MKSTGRSATGIAAGGRGSDGGSPVAIWTSTAFTQVRARDTQRTSLSGFSRKDVGSILLTGRLSGRSGAVLSRGHGRKSPTRPRGEDRGRPAVLASFPPPLSARSVPCLPLCVLTPTRVASCTAQSLGDWDLDPLPRCFLEPPPPRLSIPLLPSSCRPIKKTEYRSQGCWEGATVWTSQGSSKTGLRNTALTRRRT